MILICNFTLIVNCLPPPMYKEWVLNFVIIVC